MKKKMYNHGKKNIRLILERGSEIFTPMNIVAILWRLRMAML